MHSHSSLCMTALPDEIVCYADKDVLTAFLGDSDRNRTVVRQYMTMIPSPEGSRRLLATYAAEPSPPPPPKPDCICASELTFYITFSREDDELLLNQVSPTKESAGRMYNVDSQTDIDLQTTFTARILT